jgi:preprotein translocase subunit YajC
VDKRYCVSGLFILEVNAKDMRDARETAERILVNSGIDGKVIQVEEKRHDI